MSSNTTNGNVYQFYFPYDLSFVKVMETENNKNFLFKLKINNMYNGAPEIYNNNNINNNLK
jgi:hypothetical protein